MQPAKLPCLPLITSMLFLFMESFSPLTPSPTCLGMAVFSAQFMIEQAIQADLEDGLDKKGGGADFEEKLAEALFAESEGEDKDTLKARTPVARVHCAYMTSAWHPHGLCMIPAWHAHDFCMASAWQALGSHEVLMARVM